MPSKFISLPVSQGDFFYLYRNSKHIVFDAGRYSNVSATLYLTYTGQNVIDYLICSHNDADHAEGVMGLLEGQLTVKEVWLPARWAETITIISRSTNWQMEIIKEVLNESDELLDSIESLEDFGDRIFEKSEQIRSGDKLSKEAFDKNIEKMCDELSPNSFLTLMNIYLSPKMSIREKVIFDCIQTAERILKIATLAYSHGSVIRWFDHDKFKDHSIYKPSGGESFLRPLNSIEIKDFEIKSKKLLHELALSKVNRASLVFSSEVDHEPSVLFTADSDLANVDLSSIESSQILVTSPHHGSKANDCVYDKLEDHNPIWIRSDMRKKTRPSKRYLDQTDRYCTLCNNDGSIRSAQKFHVSDNSWHPEGHSCFCSKV